MMERNEFDELARRKLQERDHTFQDAHWAEMEKLIEADREQRRGGYWLVPVLLLLLGGGAWIFNMDKSEEIISTSEVASIEVVKNGTGKKEAAVQDDQPPIEREASIEVKQAPIGSVNNIDPSTDERAAEVKSNTVEAPATTVDARAIEVVPEENITKNDPLENNNGEVTIGSDRSEQDDLAALASMIADRSDERPVIPADQENDGLAIRSTSEHEIRDPDPMQNDPEAENDRNDLSSEYETDRIMTNEADRPAIVEEQKTDPPVNAIAPVASANEEQAEVVPDEDPITRDTTALTAPQIGTNDTIAFAAPEPGPIVDPRSPFELSIFGGSMFTTSTYSGPLSQDWNSTIEQQQTFTGGAELMRMGRNWGIGSGLHYSTYAERIISEQLDRTETVEHHYYFLSPVDTMLLLITDSTFMNGEWHYTGQSIYTTIQVLDEGYQTTTTRTRVRDARDQVDRTSYLEIPLLLDAHLTQGRWSLGLRGGPTLGVLTSHRGSVPRTDAGYLDLADQDLRSLVLGYTARAYIRHRFNAGWSIGLEPMIGGHLANSFANDDLVRRPSAFGGILSLNYRFK